VVFVEVEREFENATDDHDAANGWDSHDKGAIEFAIVSPIAASYGLLANAFMAPSSLMLG
jgi:hypothetical protein